MRSLLQMAKAGMCCSLVGSWKFRGSHNLNLKVMSKRPAQGAVGEPQAAEAADKGSVLDDTPPWDEDVCGSARYATNTEGSRLTSKCSRSSGSPGRH